MIKYYCDICEKNIVKQGLHVLTFSCPSRDTKESIHLCGDCRTKVYKFIKSENGEVNKPEVEDNEYVATIKSVKSILEKKPDWTMSSQICESFINDREEYYKYIKGRCAGLDGGKIISLMKAGWSAKNIIGEIDFQLEDIISEVIFCYEFTGDIPVLKTATTPIAQKPEEVIKPKEVASIRNIPTQFIDDFLAGMKTGKGGIRNEQRKKILTIYCSTNASTLSISRDFGVSQPCVQNLGRAYMNYCVDLGVYTIETEEPVDGSKVPEYVETLHRDSRVPNEKRIAALQDICGGMKQAEAGRKHDLSISVVTKLYKGYCEYMGISKS